MPKAAFTAAALAAAALPLAALRADTLAVRGDFATIQAAIDAAEPNDIVVVEPGTYEENLSLRSGIDVSGLETARTLLAPADDTLPTVEIAGVIGARFSNFTLVDSSLGVSVAASTGIEVANVVFDRVADRGFAADALTSVRVVNNVFYRNDTALVRGAAGIEVVNNIFALNVTAIVTTLPLVDPFANIRANCFFANEDLTTNGVDFGVGAGAIVGDPLFVDPAVRDFHLREDSVCIDVGRGTDLIDATLADAGVYGGPFADPNPFPVAQPDLSVTDAEPPAIIVEWSPNLDYRVTNTLNPGSYRVYYKRGGAPESDVPSAYDGTSAGGGTQPSPIDVAGDTTEYTLEDLDLEAEAPLAPRIRSAERLDEAVAVSWDAVEQSSGYRVYYGTSDTSENHIDVGDVTRYVVQGLVNGTAYYIAVSALNQPRYTVAVSAVDNTQSQNESALSPSATVALGEPAESPLSQTLTATPVQIVPYPDLPNGSTCLATSAFGGGSGPEVLALREFRDRYLNTNAPGRRLVRSYYALSVPAVRFVEAHTYLKPAVRAALWPFVIVALAMLEGSAASKAALLVLGITGIALRLRVRRLASQRKAQAERQLVPSACSTGARLVIAALVLDLMADPAPAQPARPPVSAGVGSAQHAPQAPVPSSPRWMYEIAGGYFYPDLDDFAAYYGSARTTILGLSFGYRFRDWLEAGAAVGYLEDSGTGRVAGGTEPAGTVDYSLVPVFVFATLALDGPERRFVPYLRLGAATASYSERIEGQPSREGRGDIGPSAALGLRWRFAAEGAARQRPQDAFWRSYVFVEAQRFSSKVADIDLGGTSYVAGVRVEFELGSAR